MASWVFFCTFPSSHELLGQMHYLASWVFPCTVPSCHQLAIIITAATCDSYIYGIIGAMRLKSNSFQPHGSYMAYA